MNRRGFPQGLGALGGGLGMGLAGWTAATRGREAWPSRPVRNVVSLSLIHVWEPDRPV